MSRVVTPFEYTQNDICFYAGQQVQCCIKQTSSVVLARQGPSPEARTSHYFLQRMFYSKRSGGLVVSGNYCESDMPLGIVKYSLPNVLPGKVNSMAFCTQGLCKKCSCPQVTCLVQLLLSGKYY